MEELLCYGAWQEQKSPPSRRLEKAGSQARQQRGSGDPNPEIPQSSALAQPRSPKPRKHISKSTTSRCARWLGSQSAGRARGAPWGALSASGRLPSSARSSPSSSSIGPEWSRKQRQGGSGGAHVTAYAHVTLSGHASPRSRERRFTWCRDSCSFFSADGVHIGEGMGVGDRPGPVE